MLYLIYGTNLTKRNLAKKNLEESLTKKNIKLANLLETAKITTENYQELENYFQKLSLFGEKLLIKIENILEKKDSREYFYQNLERLIKSENIFLLDEMSVSKIIMQKVIRDFQKIGSKEEGEIFEATEVISKKDIEPFTFCNLVEAREKKLAWEEWHKVYLEWGDSEAMALHGALWWKWKTLWQASLDPQNIYKYRVNHQKYTLEELEKYGENIAFMAMRATSGEVNLMREIEKMVLSL